MKRLAKKQLLILWYPYTMEKYPYTMEKYPYTMENIVKTKL